MSDRSSHQHVDGTAKRPRSEIQIHHIPESEITDLDQDCTPGDIVGALADLSFKRFNRGTKILRIDAHIRDFLVTAVSALSGHGRR
jgi:hypothetical protein